MIRVLGIRASSNVQKVTWLLGELGLAFEREDFGGKTGKPIKSPPYTDWNPNGTIPTLIDGDFVLWESNSICRYLARKTGAVALYPDGLEARALCERWMDWQLGTLRPFFYPYFRMLITMPEGRRDGAATAAMRATASQAFDILERGLAASPISPAPSSRSPRSPPRSGCIGGSSSPSTAAARPGSKPGTNGCASGRPLSSMSSRPRSNERYFAGTIGSSRELAYLPPLWIVVRPP